MKVSVYLTYNLTVLVTLQFTDNFPPLLLARLREPVCLRTLKYTYTVVYFPHRTPYTLNSVAALLVVLYISVGEIRKIINTQSYLVLTSSFFTCCLLLWLLYIFFEDCLLLYTK
jgi:hypothetical protein